jgi:hypothetical protein
MTHTPDPPTIVVRELDVMATATWNYRGDTPTWRPTDYSAAATFDPFPAYPHQFDEAQAAAEHVTRCRPPLWTVDLFVADREETGRTNGFSDVAENSHYEGDEWVQGTPSGLIVLSGKRTPPHPAVTRYLVAHEYGHNIEWMVNRARGAKSLHDGGLTEEYARMRGLPSVHHGTGGRWHDSVHEVFACDFRILVCGVELDHWPHPGVPRPETVSGVADWWAGALGDLDSYGEQVA